MKVPSFAEIGKQTKDLLNGTPKSGLYQYDNRFKINAKASDGVSLQLNTIKRGDKILNDVKSTVTKDQYSLEVTANQNGVFGIQGSISDFVTPGIKITGAASLPIASPPKLTVGYSRPHLNISSALGLESAPLVDASIMTGHKNFVIGGDCSYKTAKGELAKWGLGLGYTQPEYQFGLLLLNKGETVKGMLTHVLSSSTEVGAEIVKNIRTPNDGTLNIGLAKTLESGALVKAKAESSGMVSVLWEQQLDKNMKVAVSGQVEVLNFEKGAKMGIAFDMNS